jgi:dTDP-glucose 4,6-dehydratase
VSKKVLLTGAGGFAGAHFLEHVLVNTDWDVVCVDSFRHKGKTDRITGVLEARPETRSRVSVVTHDLTAPFSEQLISRIGRCQFIVAYASESHVDRAIEAPVPFIMNNTAVMLNTLEFCCVTRPDSVVVVSTDEVYGPEVDGVPYKEWATIIPSNPYSASKAAQEAIAISYWRTYGVPLMIINCMNMIGERQDTEKFVPLVIKACLQGREITIHGSEDNIGSRHYLHARNLADGIMFLLKKQTPALFSGHAPAFDVRSAARPDRWNIASADRVDNLTLAKTIASHVGKSLKYKFEDFPGLRPGHDPHYGLDPEKITVEGWTPPVEFWASLKHTVDWFLAHPEWLGV